MILPSDGKRPCVDPTARIAPNAVVSGEVTIGANVSIGFGAVVVAESGPVAIGANSVVMDTAVLRGVRRNPLAIGAHVLVGPRSYLCGCTIEDEVFLATGSTVFNGAHLGRGSEVRINAVVHLRTRLAPMTTVPIGWIAVGDPARLFPPDRHEEIWTVQAPLDFPRHVFSVPRPREGETMMAEVMPRYTAMLRARHAGDDLVSAGEME